LDYAASKVKCKFHTLLDDGWRQEKLELKSMTTEQRKPNRIGNITRPRN